MSRAPVTIPEQVRQLAIEAQGARCFFCERPAAALCSPNPPDCEETFGAAWSYTTCCKRHGERYGYQVAIPQPSLGARLRRRGRGRSAGQGGSMVISRPLPGDRTEPDPEPGLEPATEMAQSPHHRERISPLGE